MSSSRPKRKAAGNKNYSDTANETFMDSIFTAPPTGDKGAAKAGTKGAKKKTTPPQGIKNPTPPYQASGALDRNQAAKVPYNWQPQWLPRDQFSFQLDTTGGYVNFKTQTMVCPNQPAINWSNQTGSEVNNLQSKLDPKMSRRVEAKPSRKKIDSAFQLRKGDFIYMVSEPPGEPYYIGRLMGFKSKSKDLTENTAEDINNCLFQIQWFYRPRDISKQTSDSRLLYASMHSDGCPISSFRGLVNVLHKSDVELYYTPPETGSPFSSAIEYFSSFPNCFYYDKLFDRYMIKFYDIIKTSSLLPYMDNAASNSKNFILALSKRYEFVFMEATRTKTFMNNFTSTSSKHCNICAEWCPAAESVSCAECDKNFHMLCLDPPLLKKPSRGFSWSCALCTKKHELEHQSKQMLMLSHDNRSSNQEDLSNPDDDSPDLENLEDEQVTRTNIMPKYELMAIDYLDKDKDVSVTERRLREEWSMRYLGLHVRLEDAVDPDDRSPYPRASTSLGARYQASNIPEFEGHPIVYYDPIKDKTSNGKKKASNGKKASKQEEQENVKLLPIPKEYQDVSPKEFPHWLQERPKGYIERGVDDGEGETATLMWKPMEKDKAENFKTLDNYMASCAPVARKLGLHPNSPNFVDACLKAYLDCQGNTAQALDLASNFTLQTLHEPTLNKEEVKKFELGVKKYGSELFPVFKEVKTQPCSMIVRFYYLWKKTERGKLIWGNFSGRKKKPTKEAIQITSTMEDLADSDDDSAYENEKITQKKKLFKCKHCNSYESYRWFKVTGGSDKGDDISDIADKFDADTIMALCSRCAKLWRRYAVYWEDPLEVDKRVSRGVGGYKRKVESELVDDAERILKHAEEEGIGISYEVERPATKNSILSASHHESQSMGASLPKIENKPNGSPQKPKAAPKVKKAPTAPKAPPAPVSAPRLTSRQLSISNNKIEKETAPEPQPPVKRKFKEVVPKSEAGAKEDSPTAKKPTKAPSSKKNRNTPEVKEEKIEAPPTPEPKPLEPKVPPPKRSRKPNDQINAVSPIFNAAYRSTLPEIATVGKIDKKTYPKVSQEAVEKILDGYKFRQLTDLKVLAQGWQAPNQSVIDLPYGAHERNCSICLERDESEPSILEMLICSNCGVNVHGSCAGISISGKIKPVKQWLCEVCTNDLGPQFSTNYSCTLCMAKSSNREMAILGAPSEIPDYLVPILDTGKWCHLLCGLICYENIALRNLGSATFINRDVWALNSTKLPAFAIESVSRLLSSNSSDKCGICHISGGALIDCNLCTAGQTKVHVTCAQDTEKYKVGLKLMSPVKNMPSVYVAEQAGKLEPCLICPSHEQNDVIMSFRKHGKRTLHSENKHLIQLFIEDLTKLNHRPTGPQLQARNYLHKIEKYLNLHKDLPPNGSRKFCKTCKIDSSPKWWKAESSDTSTIAEVECHNCHLHKESSADQENFKAEAETELEGDSFYRELNQPLSGEQYGVMSPHDRIGPFAANERRGENEAKMEN